MSNEKLAISNEELAMRNEKKDIRGNARWYYLYSLFIFLFSFVLFDACDDHVGSEIGQEAVEKGYGKISVVLVGESEQTARTVMPLSAFDKYVYTFTKAGEGTGSEITPDVYGFFLMETGNYTLEVKAFIGTEGSYTLAAIGVSGTFSVGSGNNAPVKIPLSAVDAGRGTFNYTITYPAGSEAVITLQRWPGTEVVMVTPDALSVGNGISQTLELAVGSYLFTVYIVKDGFYTGISEAVHVYPATTTVYVKDFNDSQFIAVITQYNISGTGTVYYDGGVKTVSIIRKEYAFQGAVTVFYNGITDAPTDVGTYAITFDVAASTGFNALTGLSAGTMTIKYPAVINSIQELQAYLSAQPDSTAYTPYYAVVLNVNDLGGTSGNSGSVGYVLIANSTKCVSLDLSGSTITSIGDSAFYGCTSLTGVTIPSGVTSIGSGAFVGCTSLPAITVAAGNTAYTSDDGVLYNMSKTTLIRYPAGKTGNTFTIPNSVTSIGDYAFYGCTNLASVTIPASVTSIGGGYTSDSFQGCTSLTSVTFQGTITSDNFSYWFGSNSGVRPSFPGDLRDKYLAGGIGTYIRNSASTTWTKTNADVAPIFSLLAAQPGGDSTNTPVNLMPLIDLGVMTQANSNWQYLLNAIAIADKYVVLDLSSCTMSGGTEFNPANGVSTGKDKIVSISLPEIATGITDGSNSSNPTFRYFTSLNNIRIGNHVTSIGNYAFYGCTSLTGALTIPNGVTSIGAYAFYGCTGLTGALTIPNGVTSIGAYAFYGCTGLTGALTIPNGVTSIGNYAFYGCTGLTGALTIPNGVTSIGAYVFNGCSGLTGSLTIPNGVTSIGNNAFYGCTGLTGALTIPNGVTSIGDMAFYGCSGLTSVSIPNGITSIGEYTFSGCTSLTSVTIPNSVTSIGYRAFYECYYLTGITIPNSVTSIGNYAFYSAGLTSLTIPASVTSIGEYAFNTSYLTSVTFQGTAARFSDNSFYNTTGTPSNTLRYQYYENGIGTYIRRDYMYNNGGYIFYWLKQ